MLCLGAGDAGPRAGAAHLGAGAGLAASGGGAGAGPGDAGGGGGLADRHCGGDAMTLPVSSPGAAGVGAADLIRAAPVTPCHPWPRHVLTAEGWRAMAAALASAPELELLALWADTAQVHAAVPRQPARALPARVGAGGSRPLPGAVPAPPGRRLVRADDPRPLGPCGRRRHRCPALARPRPLGGVGAAVATTGSAVGRARAAGVPAGRGRGLPPDRGRPGACRHHRAGTFPLLRPGRDRDRGWRSGSAICTRARWG